MMQKLFQLLMLFFFISCTSQNEGNLLDEEDISDVPNPELSYRPNIVWLVAEDMSPTIPMYGDSTITTPNLSRLAVEGVVYDNFYSPHPVCAPARASIITGMYANRIAASHMRTGPWYSDNVPDQVVEQYQQYFPEGIPVYEAMPPPDARMFTEYLREAGYYCTNNSKQDYQFRKTPAAWDETSGEATWMNRKPGQPFFAVFNYGVTHESQIWAKAKDSLLLDEDAPVPVPPYLPDTEIGRNDVRRMYSNIKEMDAQVGQVLAQLEESGLLDSTIVIWYTDHGGPLPRQKRAVFDSGVKVPMIIRFPNKAFAGERDDRMISFIDLAPTAMSLAGVEPPATMDGKAFLGPHMRDEEPKYVFGAADRFDEMTDRIRFARNNQFKYIRNYLPERSLYMDVSYRKQMPIMQELLRLREENALTPEQARWFEATKPEEELYDVHNDPHELNNLAGDPDYADELQELSSAMDNWLSGFDDTGLIDEKDLIQRIWPDGEQPVTSVPRISKTNDGAYQVECDTEGAAIAYRLLPPDANGEEYGWEVYSEPVSVEEDMVFQVVAHRIGYLRSDMVTHTDGP